MPLSAKLHLHSAPVSVEVTRDDDRFTIEFDTTSAYSGDIISVILPIEALWPLCMRLNRLAHSIADEDHVRSAAAVRLADKEGRL